MSNEQAITVSPELLVKSDPGRDFGITLRLVHWFPGGYDMSLAEAKKLRDALIAAIDHYLEEREGDEA